MRERFTLDLFANLASFAVMGVAGIATNILIGAMWGAGALGVFNQVLAVYILFSQVSALGFHLAALTYIATVSDAAQRRGVLAACLLLTVVAASAATTAYWLSADFAGRWLSNGSIATGMHWAAAGLWLFSLNKVFLAALNGQNRLQLLAALQTVRAVSLVGATIVAGWLDVAPQALPAALTVAETITFLVALPFVASDVIGVRWSDIKRWTGAALNFGLRSAPSGIFSELNTRVDVLLLGIFTNDQVVGVFSFASILAEGIYQVLIVIRTVYAPLVAQALQRPDRNGIIAITKRAKRATYLGMFALGSLSFLLFPFLIRLSGRGEEFDASWPIFGILLIGIVLGAGYVPFNTMLLLAGKPNWHSIYVAGILAFNVAINLVFIPTWAAIGAAAGTALAYIFAAVSLALLARIRLSVRL